MATVFITGSNRGIGLELVRALQGRGDHVIATCRSASDALRDTGATVVEGIDVSDDACIPRLREALGGGAPDIVICNAGVLSAETLGDIDWDAMRRQFEVNTLGPLRVAEAVLPSMQRGGKFVIITSRMGSVEDNTSGGMYGYRVSKAGVNMVGRSLAHDVADRGIAVQLLHPGYVRTDMTKGNGLIDPDESAATLIARIDELTAEQSGTFRHQNGEMLPW